MIKYLFLPSLITILISCSPSTKSENTGEATEEAGEYVEYNNPPAEGFNQEGSDVLAMLLADKVMDAMGGREAWDNTRFISWNFFGRRSHVWDKQTGNVRIEEPSNNLTILMNINTKEGKVMLDGEELAQPDSLAKYLDLGYKYWVNDSYWLVMPYKLKDSGVTLKYIAEDTTQQGEPADVIQLSFEDVGVTPENMYYVWVDVDSKLITQWAYYPSIESEEARFITPWSNYQRYGNIMLSGDRGDYQLTDIKVLDNVPESTFSSFEPMTL